MTTYSLKKQALFVFTLMFLTLFITLLLGEVFVRLTKEYVTPEIIRERSLEYSKSLFSRHVFPLKKQILEQKSWIINAKGYRGDDFKSKKDDGTIRVIVYGGSAAFDLKVPNGKDWPYRIGQRLKDKGIKKIEVINAGIPAHASFDSFGRLFAEGHIFEPDYVILYNAWNDIKYFSNKESLLRTFSSHGSSEDFRSNYQGFFDQILCEISQLYVRLRHRYYNWKYDIGDEGIIQSGEYTKEVSELGLKQYRLNVEMFIDLARNINAVPILITQARLVAGDNTDEDKSRIVYKLQKMRHQVLVQAFEKTDEIIMDVAKSKHVLMIDASVQMTGKGEYFSDHIHLSDNGSNQLAIIVSEFLFPLLSK